MKIIKPGFQYGLHNVENPQLKGQVIEFIETEQDGKLVRTIKNGTSLEELLEVALAKAQYDNRRLITVPGQDGNVLNPDATREKSLAVTAIEEAILWLKRDKELRANTQS